MKKDESTKVSSRTDIRILHKFARETIFGSSVRIE